MKHKELIEEPVVQNSVETSVGETIRAADKSLTTDDLVVMVEQVKLKLSKTMVYQENIREELKAYTFVRPREDSKELGVLKEAYDGLYQGCHFFCQVFCGCQSTLLLDLGKAFE